MLVSCVCFSCSKSRKDLILGAWKLTDARAQSQTDKDKIEITFYKNGVLRSEKYVDGKVAASDSITYVLTNDGQFLDTKESNGRNERVKILELNDKTLKIKPENQADSLAITLTRN